MSIGVGGMTCASCVATVEKALSSVPGVESASVNLPLERAEISFSAAADMQAVIHEMEKFVEAAGYSYQAIPGSDNDSSTKSDRISILKARFLTSLALTLPILAIAMIFKPELPPIGPFNGTSFLLLLLSIPVWLWSGFPFHRGALHSLKSRVANMDVLVSMGTSVAFFWSTGVVLSEALNESPGIFIESTHLYFDGMAVIITLVLMGSWLEARAKSHSTDAVYSLMDLQPEVAVRVEGDNEEKVRIESIEVGDLVKVRSGEPIPLDGVVVEGGSSIDESMVSGEPLPIYRTVGEEVIGGTMNLDGVLIVRISRIGKDTMLAQVIELVEQAQAGKAPIQRLVDRISSIFVPVVVIAAILSAIFWSTFGARYLLDSGYSNAEFSMLVLVSTLVIACPCALGLATPTALMVGTGTGARNGLLIKGIEALERAHKIDFVVVDKTGTLTEGKPVVVEYNSLSTNFSNSEILYLAASLERNSTHPLAEAIVLSSDEQDDILPPESIDVIDFQTHGGSGLSGTVGSGEYKSSLIAVGNTSLMREFEVNVPLDVSESVIQGSVDGQVTVLVSLDNELIGTIVLADSIREYTEAAISSLNQMGISVVMLTGDTEGAANYVANEVGINRVIAEVKPDEKASAIRKIQSDGGVVAMIGDGINDAAALTQADLGIAMGAGSGIALESSDIVLVKNDVRDVVASIDLARATMKKISSNLFWAFIYNVIGIPLAMGLLYPSTGWLLPPTFAAAAMSLSSVSVVSNSLLLNTWKHPLHDSEVLNKNTIPTEESSMEKLVPLKIELRIEGMTCGGCSRRVMEAIEAVSGVIAAEVSHESNNAIIEIEPQVKDADLIEAISSAGYNVLEVIR